MNRYPGALGISISAAGGGKRTHAISTPGKGPGKAVDTAHLRYEFERAGELAPLPESRGRARQLSLGSVLSSRATKHVSMEHEMNSLSSQ